MNNVKFDIAGLNPKQQNDLLELLWDSMHRDKGSIGRVRTGWGTKTREGLLRCIARIAFEESDAAATERVLKELDEGPMPAGEVCEGRR